METRTFKPVWYLPKENEWGDRNLLAMRDSGKLIIGDDSLEFKGKSVTIHITDIQKVSFGKQGRDFINNWVKVEYQDGNKAFFMDGSWLGWGGMFGGTKKILDAVRHLEHSSK